MKAGSSGANSHKKIGKTKTLLSTISIENPSSVTATHAGVGGWVGGWVSGWVVVGGWWRGGGRESDILRYSDSSVSHILPRNRAHETFKPLNLST